MTVACHPLECWEGRARRPSGTQPRSTSAENQRPQSHVCTKGNGTLEITSPANADLAPPALYMLFAVNSAGAPSIASIVKVGNAGAGTVSCAYPDWLQGRQYAAAAIVTYQG